MKPKWQKNLTKWEIEHIKVTTDSNTLKQFKRNRTQHRSHTTEPCVECRHIAIKIGIES